MPCVRNLSVQHALEYFKDDMQKRKQKVLIIMLRRIVEYGLAKRPKDWDLSTKNSLRKTIKVQWRVSSVILIKILEKQ